LSEIGISDEMNLHTPQSVGARAELAILMRSAVKIVSPQNNGPVVGIVQDGLDGGYLLSNTWSKGCFDTLVKKATFFDCIAKAGIPEIRIKDLLRRAQKWYPEFINKDLILKGEVPGKLMFSILFPPNLCCKRYTDTSKDFPQVNISHGVILPDSGPICKKIIGVKQNSVIHRLWLEYSPEVASTFITETQKLIDNWLPHHGFSVGISDCLLESEGRLKVIKALAETQIKVQKLSEKFEGEDLEDETNAILNEANNIGALVASQYIEKGERNALNIMRLSGAKGNVSNLASITAFVGQQNIEGERIPLLLSGGTRSLPRFEPGDNSPEARGMIASSYLFGLNPAEVFFHAMAGRIGMMQTAMGTGETGYIQKKITRKIEDCRFCIDGTVRDSNNRIIQFLYGDDGLSPQKISSCPGVKFPFFVNPENIAKRMNAEVEQSENRKAKLRKLRKKEIDLLLTFISAGAPGIQTEVTRTATESLRKALRICLERVEIYESRIADLCGEISSTLEASKAQHGDMVGLIAASSLGEPTTQMTLNVFHSTGRKGADVSLGVPRLKEIISITKSPKSPSCTIYFADSFLEKCSKSILDAEKSLLKAKTPKKRQVMENVIRNNQEACRKHLKEKQKNFEEVRLGTLLSDYEMQYIEGEVDPETDASPTGLLFYQKYEAPWWVDLSLKLHGGVFKPSKWVLILKMDVELMHKKSISIEEISDIIKSYCEDHVACISSPNNMGVIHISINYPELRAFLADKGYMSDNKILNTSGYPESLKDSNLEYFQCRDRLLPHIKNIKLSGVDGIDKVIPYEDPQTHEWCLNAKGSNFKGLLACPEVDSKRTITNHIREIYQTLGIEAARRFMIEDISRVLSFGGTYINPRHAQLFIDSMTNTGELMNASRYGISREEGPIKKIMFEQSLDNATEASAFTEEDNLLSVSSSVMYGKIAKAGTGMVSIKRPDQIPRKIRTKRR